MLSGGLPNTAFAHLRLASNDLLLAHYWHYHILPRSQNRTVYLLKQNAQRFGFVDFYHTFIPIFGLNQPLPAMKQGLFQARSEIYQVANAGWDSNAVLFFCKMRWIITWNGAMTRAFCMFTNGACICSRLGSWKKRMFMITSNLRRITLSFKCLSFIFYFTYILYVCYYAIILL